MNAIRTTARILPACAALFLASCAGAKFNQDWNQSVAAYRSGEAKDAVAGPWTGTWLSHDNGHHGDLRCLVTPLDEKGAEGQTHRFRYHATWGKIFSGGYAADYQVQRQGRKGHRVTGEKDLGVFGRYQHDGMISGDRFDATYAADKGDHGVFELRRP